jgi:hypothetical protein
MMKKGTMPRAGILLLALCAAGQAAAQSPAPAAPKAAAVDPASVPMPKLAFAPDAEIERNYFKYFFFHREETDFATAYADLQECDGYARGLSHRASGGAVPYPYAGTIGGAVGGVIGSVVADAVFGSSQRRMQRRVIMRTCMGFKEYKTYGLPKDLWGEFHFDEGNSGLPEERRDEFLRMQARAASGPRPQTGEMGQ